jgi:DNA modification methylase
MICEDELMKMAPDISDIFSNYVREQELSPLFLQGDALSLLQQLPDESIDCCMTSPPYWNKRQYQNGGIGLEADYRAYIADLTEVCAARQMASSSTPSAAPALLRWSRANYPESQ